MWASVFVVGVSVVGGVKHKDFLPIRKLKAFFNIIMPQKYDLSNQKKKMFSMFLHAIDIFSSTDQIHEAFLF